MTDTEGTDHLSHRVSVIVLADIVGYSRLMEADEDGTYAAMQTLRQEITEPIMAKYNGRVAKFTGDGFLAEFPTIHGAIEFATEMQRALYKQEKNQPQDKRIVLRIGINIGDIIISKDGDMYGDGINIVSRLEELAYPGGIRVSDPVYQIVHRGTDISFIEVEQSELKGGKSNVKMYDIDLGSTGWPRPKRTEANGEKLNLKVVMALSSVIIISLLAVILWQNFSQSEVPELRSKSVAVLPFSDLSADNSQEYFADGMAEEILTVLASIDGLNVTSRTSSFAFKDKGLGIPEIADQLGVNYIVGGSIRNAAYRKKTLK